MRANSNRMERLPEPTYSADEKALVMKAFTKSDEKHVSEWIRNAVLERAKKVNKK